MKEKLKKSSGITLIALIITIIVMLILVVVTVTIAKDGGLFTTARNAKTSTQKEADRENLLIEVMGGFKAGGEFDISAVNLPDNMKWCDKDDNDFNNANKEHPSKGEASWVITKNNNKFYVDAYGNVQNEPTQESITWEEAYTKGWLYLDDGEEKILRYGGTEKSIVLTQKIDKVPVFEALNEEEPTFKGYIDFDTTRNDIKITFFENEDIEQVDFNNLKIMLATDCFNGCKSLTSVSNMQNITKIPTGAFANCVKLNAITIPSSVTAIEERAFENSTNLTQITINKAENSISGAPWGAPNATVTWQE